MSKLAIGGVIVLLLVVLAFTPWLMFWAIGVLFDYHIAVTLKTWAAAMVLAILASGSGHRRSP